MIKEYGHWEQFVVKECVDEPETLREALDRLAEVIESSRTISLDSSCNAMISHPCFRAIRAVGEPALAWLHERLRKPRRKMGWEIEATEAILLDLGVPMPNFPESHRGKVDLIWIDVRKHLKKSLTKSGRLKHYAKQEPGRCKCGRRGEWIADGISRYGFYCKRCSRKALENA